MSEERSILMSEVAERCNLEPVYLTEDYQTLMVTKEEVNRPGLQFALFYDLFEPQRIQVIGKSEQNYFHQNTVSMQMIIAERFCSSGIRVMVFAHIYGEDEIPRTILDSAKRHNVNVFRTDTLASSVVTKLVLTLHNALAPRITLHGVLMEICGEGVMICGESGVGKSEAALALLRRGHRLVADDAVEIRRINRNQLMGNAPEMIRSYMEVRGIGVVNVQHLFGVDAIKPEKEIDLIVEFEEWDDDKNYDRLGLEELKRDILGVQVPLNIIPVRPGRNLAAILELAAINNREKKMGYNAAEILVTRYDRMIDNG